MIQKSKFGWSDNISNGIFTVNPQKRRIFYRSGYIFECFNHLALRMRRNGGFPLPIRNLLSLCSQRRQFHVKRLKSWRFDNLQSNFGHIFTVRAQKRLLVIIMTPEFDFLSPVLQEIWGRFQLFISINKLKIHHISTSGLFDLLT